MSIYTASKTKHANRWKEMRAAGWDIISTWIDEAGEGQTKCLSDLWSRCIREASTADVTLLYVEPGEYLKGALVEVGAALASGKLVFVVGNPPGTWTKHRSVTLFASLDEALDAITGME